MEPADRENLAAGARAVLVKHALSELIQPQKVIFLSSNSTVEATLQLLAGKKILSAPVLHEDADGEPNQVDGFVDIRDIVSSFLLELDMEKVSSLKMLQRMRYLEDFGEKFSSKPIRDLPVQGGDGSFLLQAGKRSNLTLLEVVHDGFLYPKETHKAVHGGDRSTKVVHRAALFDREGKIVNIISQSDIIRFIHRHVEELGPLAGMSVEALGWGQKPVMSVLADKPAIHVLGLMAGQGISAVAVTSPAGRLIGNFSASELRTILSEHFGSLALPVGEFLALEHGVEFWGRADNTADEGEADGGAPDKAVHFARERGKREPELRRVSHSPSEHMRRRSVGELVGQDIVCADREDTLATLLAKLVRHRLHRLYVVDDDTRPVGIITLTDILRKLTDLCQ